jgi:DNA modification methylase
MMSMIPDNFVDLVITSPPYDEMRDYEGKKEVDFNLVVKELFRILKKGGIVVWVIADQTKNFNESGTSFKHALGFKKNGFNLFDTMIYLKPPRGACGNNKSYWQTFEYMFVFSKGRPNTINLLIDRKNKEKRKGDTGSKRLKDGSLKTIKRKGYGKKGRRTNVWKYNIGNGHTSTDDYAKLHPATFPEKLAEDHILSWSNKKDIVYDPFMGSGTTAKMALKNSRNYIGSEIVKKYCEICERRLKKNE